MKVMRFLSIFGVLLAGAAVFAAKPVGIMRGMGCDGLSELISATVFNPQWTHDKPLHIKFNGNEFNKISTLIYIHGNSVFRFRKFDKNFIADLEKFVANGGTFITLINGGTYAGEANTKAMAKLLGAEKFVVFDSNAKILDPAWKDCGKNPDVFEHMLAPKSKDKDGKLQRVRQIALSGLTTAKNIIGNQSGSLVSVNKFGKGKVYFINIRLTESFTSYTQPYHDRANAALEQYFPFAKKLHSIIMANNPALSKEKRELWDYMPLGPAAKPLKVVPRTPKKLVSNRKFTKLDGEKIELVSGGQPQAILVIQRVGERGAFNMLNHVLKNMCGVTLPMTARRLVKEKDGIWSWRRKPYKTLVYFEISKKVEIKANGNKIVISAPTPSLGIQTFMKEILGYRMLWPGEGGEVFVKTADVKIAPFELTDISPLRKRCIRNGLSSGAREWKNPEGKIVKVNASDGAIKNCNILGWDVDKVVKMRAGHAAWNAPQRLGGSLNEGGGGNFYSWQNKYGKTEPEVLGLQFETVRKMKTKHVRICKSNPETIKLAAKEALENLKKPRYKNVEYYRFSPSDGGYDIMCMCENCRKWDPSNGNLSTKRVFLGRNRPVYRYPGMTDRVLRFTCEAVKELQKSRPDIKGVYLAYAGYLAPPEYYRDFPDNMLITFVGGEYLNIRNHARDREYWDFWSSVASELCWRPNFLGGGSGMPFLYYRNMAEDLKHFAATGMVGGDFDTLPHHWATNALNYYVLANLLWNPAASVDDLVDDFCKSGFGTASEAMKKYYAHCEKLTDVYRNSGGVSIKSLEDITEIPASRFGRFCRVFTPEEFRRLETLLNDARNAAGNDESILKRIDFVSTGLEFFKRNSEFARKYWATPAKERKKLIPEIDQLVSQWKEMFHKYPFAINVIALADDYFYEFFRNCGWKARRAYKK